jgi:hypothetical protein
MKWSALKLVRATSVQLAMMQRAKCLKLNSIMVLYIKYSGVPEYEYNGIMNADSKGKYFHAHIKNGGYSYQRL